MVNDDLPMVKVKPVGDGDGDLVLVLVMVMVDRWSVGRLVGGGGRPTDVSGLHKR